jgi:hypothetical protein
MFSLLSPAKKLVTKYSVYTQKTSMPEFSDKTEELIKLMRKKSVAEIAQLMDLSKDLAELNFNRYQKFHLHNCPDTDSYPALLYFQGDVYQGLQAATWDKADIDFSQMHLGILSGLYGLLKPLDRMQAYRLEMGVRLANPAGANLYDFWRPTITQAINQHLKSQQNPILLNLASGEYFKAVDEKKLDYPVVTINFYENKNGTLKMVGIYAKKARGAMAKYLMQNKIDDLEGVKLFHDLGYQFSKDNSGTNHLDFIRN